MYYIGADLGKQVDFTAIAIVEREERPRAWMEPLFLGLSVRWLERVPLGTSYTGVVRRIVDIGRQLGWNCGIAVDATSMGAPVIDMLREAPLQCEMVPVVITAGEEANSDGRVWRAPKRDLISGLQLNLEKGLLRIARDLRQTPSLVEELVEMRTIWTRTGRVSWGAVGVGRHDDLVTATALGCWMAERPTIGNGVRRLPGI
ncbi:MAG: hypothetical protein JSU00_10340 [Acidobacteria bacterium]|nr:hypothetical protein [Acidobacteriota bacterium]